MNWINIKDRVVNLDNVISIEITEYSIVFKFIGGTTDKYISDMSSSSYRKDNDVVIREEEFRKVKMILKNRI